MPGLQDSANNTVLVVDDDADNRALIAEALLPEFKAITAQDGREGLDLLARAPQTPLVIVSDVNMPRMDGLEMSQRVRIDPRLRETPIMLLTGNADRDFKLRALELGIDDYVCKPADLDEVKLRVRNLANVSAARGLMRTYAEVLEQSVEQRTRELTRALTDLSEARTETIMKLSVACEYRDDDTAQHLSRMAAYSAIIARGMGMTPAQVEMITTAAPMHDVGKIGVPDNILLKPGKLTADEFRIMQRHPGIGGRILGNSHSPVLKVAELIALSHHEKWNGSGYPRGLKESQIPIEGRIVALADVFDALTTQRCYKPAFPVDRSLEIIHEGDGSHFDPKVTSAFFAALDEVREVCRSMHSDDQAYEPGK
ncbi:MAG: response regulator [Planctomycetes bacterium]|nr:response regulator [Planctomycetota bacterium]